jgi:hypothetical protein
MSSILTALKKLETESGKPPSETLPSPIFLRPVPRTYRGSRRLLFKSIGAVALLALCAGGGFFLFKPSPIPVSAPVLLSTRKKPAMAPKATARSLPAAAVAQAKNPPPAISPVQKPHIQKPQIPVPKLPKLQKAEKPQAQPMAPKSPVAPNTPKALLPASVPVFPVKDSGLKLQALSWSPDPSRRMAVVNGQILREGSSIDGKNVERIEKDAVVFRQGTVLQRLNFSIR